MTLVSSILIGICLAILLGVAAIGLTGYLLSVPLTTGGRLAGVRNTLVVLGALPGGVVLLLLGPFLPDVVGRALVQAFPEPQIGSTVTPRQSTGFSPADD